MTNSVNVWGYLEEYYAEKEDIHKAIERVLSSGKLILGPEVQAFENEFSAYIDAKFGIGVNSATDAIFLALKAVGVGFGDEVITVSNTAVPTVSAIRATGADVKFVDILETTYNIDPNLIEASITKQTKAIVVVHLYGQCADMGSIMSIAKSYGLHVVEDCAQAHGSAIDGKKAGTFGIASAFSFYPTKTLGGYGDGD